MKKIPDDLKSLEERINKQRAVEKAARKDRPESKFAYATKTGFRVGTELVSGVLEIVLCLILYFRILSCLEKH